MPNFICSTCGAQFTEADQSPGECRICTFMYSYPNLIPLPASTVRRIVAAVEPFEFDRIYGAWWGKTVFSEAKGAVKRLVERYIRAIQD